MKTKTQIRKKIEKLEFTKKYMTKKPYEKEIINLEIRTLKWILSEDKQ